MYRPEYPSDEEVRLVKLFNLGILDTPPDAELDRITRLAKRTFNVDSALISLIDARRQWFKSAAGLDTKETPRDISLCGHAILGKTTFVINNALEDERFFDNPLVTGPPHIRFYAGQPLQSIEGYNLGTLCLLDSRPRQFSREDQDCLVDLAKLAERYLQTLEASQNNQKIEYLLQNTNSLLEKTIRSLGVGIIWISLDKVIVETNHVACDILGHPAVELRKQSLYDLVHSDDHANLTALFSKPHSQKSAAATLELRLAGSETPQRWIQLNLSALQEDGQDSRYFIGILTDISDRKKIESDLERLRHSLEQRVAGRTQKLKQAIATLNNEIERRRRSEITLKEEKEHFLATLENANDAFVEIGTDGRIQAWNRAAEKLFSWSRKEALGQDLADTIIPPESREHHRHGLARFIRTGHGDMMGKRIEVMAMKKSGDVFPVELTLGFAKTNDSLSINAFLHDISDRKELQNKLEREALHDALTGLPNRRYFMRLLQDACNKIADGDQGIALLFLDLDGFKQINDTHGHEFGDKVLLSFATVLRDCVRNSDHVCRLAGDEFTIILENLKNPDQDAKSIAQKILHAVQMQRSIGDIVISISTSIGIATADSHHRHTGAALLKSADQAMYKAKIAGKNQFCVA